MITNLLRRVLFFLHLEKGMILDMALQLCPKEDIIDLGPLYISHREIPKYDRTSLSDSRVTIVYNGIKVFGCDYLFHEIYHTKYFRYRRDYVWFKMLCNAYSRRV